MSIRFTVDPQTKVPAIACSWLEKIIGKFNSEFIDRGANNRTRTWRIVTAANTYFFKIFRESLRCQNEVFAYENWSAAYSPFVPTLIGIYENGASQGILTTAMDGIPLRKGSFSSETIVLVYERAGQLCRNLENYGAGARFGFPNSDYILADDDNSQFIIEKNDDPVEYVRCKFLNLVEVANKWSVLDSHEKGKINKAISQLEIFANEKPVPVNTDFTPGNWLVNDSGQFIGVVDLEHITWEISIFALTRLISIYFPYHEDGRLAFYDGYQQNLESEKSEQVQIVLTMDGLRYLVKGFEEDDPLYISRGRDILREL